MSLPRPGPWQLLLAFCLAFAASPSWSAASALNGSSVYTARCASCHGSADAPAISQVLLGRNAPRVIRDAIAANIGGMGVLATVSAAEIDDVAAFLGNAPSTITFPVTAIGQSSAPRSITVRASTRLALASLSATASGDFRVSGGTCGTGLAAGQSCTVDVVFAPAVNGRVNGNVLLTNSAIAAGIDIPVGGTGFVATPLPVLTLDAASLAFGDQVVGVSSAPRSITVSNTGTGPLNFSTIALRGDLAADFSSAGTCRVGTPLAVNTQCTLTVTFTPSATGGRLATLAVESDGGTAQVPVSGRGVSQPAPLPRFTPAQVAFGNQNVGTPSAPQSIILANGGNATLNITSIRASAPFAVVQNDCSGTLAALGVCEVLVSFTPQATGPATGTLTLASNAAGTAPAVALSGTGTVAAPRLAWTPAPSLAFDATTLGSAHAVKALTLTNQGPGSVTFTGFVLGGANPGDFLVDVTGTCSVAAPLAAGSSCQVAIGFVPQAVGDRSASLVVESNGSSPGTAALTGSAVSAPVPVSTLSTASLTFDSRAPANQGLTISNTGSAPLDVASIATSSPAFTVTGGGAHACTAAPLTLQPGASCDLVVAWNGAEAAGSLTVTTNAQGSPQSVMLAGQVNNPAATPSNHGGGGCTMGDGTGMRDPTLILLALAAGALVWRRRRLPQGSAR